MEDQSSLVKLDSLLLQLALETRDLSRKKDDLTQQIQIRKADIQVKKKFIDETHKAIKKVEEDIQQKQNSIKCHKENLKSLRGTSDLLLQYEKTLEAELERSLESYNQDTKMFQERMENYWKIFEEHKEEYLQNPLAKKLLKIQAENEEIEKRNRVIEEEIIAKEKELKALKEGHDMCDSVEKNVDFNDQKALPSESDAQSEVDKTSDQDPQPQQFLVEVTETEQEDDKAEMDKKVLENNQDQADGGEANSSDVGVNGSIGWTNSEIREQCQGADQIEQEHTEEADMNMNISCGSRALEEVMEAEEQQETTLEEGSKMDAVCPSTSPAQTSELDVPTFCLISSTSTSQDHQEGRETPAFVFSMNTEPNTPTFSGFDCNFAAEPSHHEESPFTFTSSYFSKKSPETKLPGFLFDESESRTEEEFAFPFSSRSPQSKESTDTGNTFPFSFDL